MRPALLVFSLLLLLLLLVQTEGIRLEPGLTSVGHQRKIHEVKETGPIEARVGEVILCRDGYCSGRSRKLMTKDISSASTTSKSVKSEGTEVDPSLKYQSNEEALDKNKESLSVNSSPVSEHRVVVPEPFPDIIDIAGMDYSPARRKPPIHN